MANTCFAPMLFWVCHVNGFKGCCLTNPCGELEPTCPCTSSSINPILSPTTTQFLPIAGTDPAGLPTLPAYSPSYATIVTPPAGPPGSLPTELLTATGMPSVVVSESWAATASYQWSSGFQPGGESTTGFTTMSTTISTLPSTPANSASPMPGLQDNTAPASLSPGTKGGIAVGVMGGVAVLAFLSWLLLFCCSRRRWRRKRTGEKPERDFGITTQYEIPPAVGRAASGGASGNMQDSVAAGTREPAISLVEDPGDAEIGLALSTAERNGNRVTEGEEKLWTHRMRC